MAKPRAILITGLRRTGTTVFHHTLGAMPGYRDCGEVCNRLRGQRKDTEAFYTFLERDDIRQSDLLLFTWAQYEKLLDDYLAYLGSLHGTSTLVLDIKYEFLHLFTPTDQLFTQKPLLLSFCRKRSIPVLHFTRSNLLEVYCSLQYGISTDKWHFAGNDGEPANGTEAAGTTLHIKPFACVAWLEAAKRAIDLVRGWLEEQPGAMELSYDRLYEDSRFSPDSASALENVLGVELPIDSDLVFRKTPIRYRALIENMDEVSAALRGAGLGWMAEELE